MSLAELAGQIAGELIRKSGVREWEDVEAAAQIAQTAYDMAELIWNGPDTGENNVALPDYFKRSIGTAITIKNSGGTAAITLASLANGNGTSAGARQWVTLDFGASWDQEWRLECNFELAATPTAGAVINIYGSWQDATGAGLGNTSGADAAYTGYSNNIDAAAKHLEFLGAFVCTSQATATVQKGCVGLVFPKARYLNGFVDNRSGAAFHSTETNQVLTFTPIVDSIVD